MAYVLTASQIASITRERDSLQETLDTYDSQAFQDSVAASIAEAQNVDTAVLNVWTSASRSSDGVDPRELVLQQLDGQTVTNLIPFNDMSDSQPLFLMGTVRGVTDAIINLSTSEPFKISNSARIRLNVNRYYPDVDNKDDRPSSDSRNVFDDHPWEAWEGTEGTELDYTGLRTIYQDGIYGTARGTPGTTTGPGTAVDNPAVEGTSQTSIDDGGQACFIGDNERFFIAISNYLSSQHNGPSLPGSSLASNVSNLSVRGELTGGTCTITNSVTGTSSGITRQFAVEDILNINGAIVRVVEANVVGMESCTMPVPPSMSMTCTLSTAIRYLILNSGTPANGTVTSANQTVADSAAKRTNYLNLKRFTIVIPKSEFIIDTPAINDQAAIDTERAKLILELGTAAAGLYATRYDIANTRCNWNNGTLSAFFATLFTRANLLSNANGGFEPNEYSRTRDKIAELQAILDGAS